MYSLDSGLLRSSQSVAVARVGLPAGGIISLRGQPARLFPSEAVSDDERSRPHNRRATFRALTKSTPSSGAIHIHLRQADRIAARYFDTPSPP